MRRVLVVDDERVIRDLLRFALEAEGYEVTLLSDGRRVVETLREWREPCVLLMDLMMPEKTGWEVCQELATAPELARHALVVMSGSLQPGDIPPAPARCLIAKPFMLDNVLEIVARVSASLETPVAGPLVVGYGASHVVAR